MWYMYITLVPTDNRGEKVWCRRRVRVWVAAMCLFLVCQDLMGIHRVYKFKFHCFVIGFFFRRIYLFLYLFIYSFLHFVFLQSFCLKLPIPFIQCYCGRDRWFTSNGFPGAHVYGDRWRSARIRRYLGESSHGDEETGHGVTLRKDESLGGEGSPTNG